MPRTRPTAILLALKPRWWDAIREGRKVLELRKYFDSDFVGLPLYLYVTRPIQRIVGSARIAYVHRLPIDRLWKLASRTAAVTRTEFDAYFGDRIEGVGIQLADIQAHRAVLLSRIREVSPGWMPPMSHLRVDQGDPILQVMPRR